MDFPENFGIPAVSINDLNELDSGNNYEKKEKPKKPHLDKIKKEVVYNPKIPLKVLKQTVESEKTPIKRKPKKEIISIEPAVVEVKKEKNNNVLGEEIFVKNQDTKKNAKKEEIKTNNIKDNEEKSKTTEKKVPKTEEIESIEVTNDTYIQEYETLVDQNISILTIQDEMIAKGMIKKSEKGNFGTKTAEYIYWYHPEYYSNSQTLSIKQRAEKLILLNEKIDKVDMINSFHNKIKKYAHIRRKSKTGVMLKGENWEKYLLDPNNKYNYGNYKDTKKYNTIPKYNTAIANGLSNIMLNEDKLQGLPKNNNIYIFRNSFNNKFVLTYFLGRKLRVATYVSPGRISMPSEKVVNGKIGGKGSVEFNHISDSNDPENRKNPNTGWVMPNSIPIPTKNPKNAGQYLHASLLISGEPASHGCVRIPPFYSEVISQYLNTISSRITFLDTK